MRRILGKAMLILICASAVTGCRGITKEHDGQEAAREEASEAAGEQAARKEASETAGGQAAWEGASETAGGQAAWEGAPGAMAPGTAGSEAGRMEPGAAHDNMIQAIYPQMVSYPDEQEYTDKKTGEFDNEEFSKAFDAWWEQKRSRRAPEGCGDSLKPFFLSSIRQFLTEEAPEGQGENRVYSPLNVYMALSMLAETTDGDSRQQILGLLGMDSLESLRTQAEQIWNANYVQDKAVTSLLANSLWLNEEIQFKGEALDALAEHYYATSCWGKMGTKEFDAKLQNWLNEQTGDLLKEQASGLHMSDDTWIALASTIYYRAKWSEEFSKSNTREETFHGPQEDVTCDFMHQKGPSVYYWGEKFGAVHKWFQESGGMWLILPDEGITPEQLLLEDEAMELCLSKAPIGQAWENQKHLVVNLAMPKFDVVSNIDLKDGLTSMGVTDVFDGSRSDFTPLAEGTKGIYLSQASHAARVMVDEEGCIAAAYTVMAGAGAAMPPNEEMDFVLDRPFIFVITSDSGMPLFAGIVKRP